MNPIKMNDFNETLVELSKSCGQAECADEHRFPSSQGSPAGTHEGCGSYLYIRRVSNTHKAVFCDLCGRVKDSEFPIEKITTYGELRQWCTANIDSKYRSGAEVQGLLNQHGVYGGPTNG